MRALVQLLCVVGLIGCAEPAPPPSVLLVSVDTLRADRLGAYGCPLPTSPAIDAWARRGMRFEHVAAAAPSTLLSHASIFTSAVPQSHGASHIRRRAPDPRLATLAEQFRAAGYRTAAFHDGAQMAPELGLSRGFELYAETRHPGAERRFEHTVGQALAWIDSVGEAPFFLFLHTYEVHHPYRPREAAWRAIAPAGASLAAVEVEELERLTFGQAVASPERRAEILLAYAAGVRSVDDAFARLLAGLERRGLGSSIVVALTADHGEELGEHGGLGWHSHTVYEELLRVPWIVVGPGVPAAVVETPVRSIDIAPTLLALVGLPADPRFEGVARYPILAAGTRLPAIALGETAQRRFAAIRVDRWKLADGRLFDLRSDPGEHRDLSAERPDIRRRLEARLSAAETGATGEAVHLDPETEGALRSLGYAVGAR